MTSRLMKTGADYRAMSYQDALSRDLANHVERPCPGAIDGDAQREKLEGGSQKFTA